MSVRLDLTQSTTNPACCRCRLGNIVTERGLSLETSPRVKKMPVPEKNPALSRVVCRPPAEIGTTVNIADIYNKVERSSSYQTGTPPWRSYRHVTNARELPDRKRESNPRLTPDTQSLPDRVQCLSSPEASCIRPDTAVDVFPHVTRSPTPDQEVDEGYVDRKSASRCPTPSEVGEYVLHGSESSEIGADCLHRRPRKDVTTFSEPSRYAASRGFCFRSRSALVRDSGGRANDLAIQCCDVLGPKICHECALIRRRSRDTRRYESYLPRVEISHENLTTALLVARNYPNMSTEEIEAKLARGEILRPVFKYNLERMAERKRNEDRERKAGAGSAPKRNRSRNANGATYNFFTSVKDLNDKIIRGQLVRRIILSGDPEKDLVKRPSSGRDEAASFSETLSPAFISLRKLKARKSRELARYEPPLVPKVCQNYQSLHSGSQQAFSSEVSR